MLIGRNVRRPLQLRASAPPAVAVGVAIAALVIGSLDVLVLSERIRTTAVTLEDALEEYRNGDDPDGSSPATNGVSHAGSSPSPMATAGEPAPSAPGTPGPDGAGAASTDEPSPPPPGNPAAALAFTRPTAGVYTYRTKGFETISFGGARHDYPSETPLTVRHGQGCRWDVDHQVSREHRDRREYCSEPGQLLFFSAYSEITFYGQTDGGGITCDPPQVILHAEDRAGMTRHDVCGGDGTESRERATYLGRDDLTIGGVVVSAHRVRYEAEISGRGEGWSRGELWLHPDTGLMLKQVRETQTTTTAFLGSNVTYHEQASFELAHLTPRT